MTKNNTLLWTMSPLVNVIKDIDNFERIIIKQNPLLILHDYIHIDPLCNTKEFNLIFPVNDDFQKLNLENTCIKALALKQNILFVDIKVLFSYMAQSLH